MSQGSNTCVLVVDDEADLRETLHMVLQLEGYRVVTARDGAEALARLRDGGVFPCLILLDIMMPRMNGVQFRQEQMSDPALRDIPVVVLTGGSEAVLSKAAALGLEALRKPVKLDALLSAVGRFCSASRSDDDCERGEPP
jgi:CheY-like chemotaxis protein